MPMKSRETTTFTGELLEQFDMAPFKTESQDMVFAFFRVPSTVFDA